MTDDNMTNNSNPFAEGEKPGNGENIPKSGQPEFIEGEVPGPGTPETPAYGERQPGYGQIDPSFAPGYGGGGSELPPKKSVLPKVL
ncbi:MAG: hypothetical protein LBU86_05275, partial [Oscillospiraceae bacterium]|nr:hypothetical protein [Oscillospiraceae bacterium]